MSKGIRVTSRTKYLLARVRCSLEMCFVADEGPPVLQMVHGKVLEPQFTWILQPPLDDRCAGKSPVPRGKLRVSEKSSCCVKSFRFGGYFKKIEQNLMYLDLHRDMS